MNERCTAPETGTLLHAYELGILPESDSNDFEQHLLVCNYCSDLVEQFEKESEILRTDRKLLSAFDEQKETSDFRPASRSFFARPAVGYAIAALLALMLVGSWMNAPSQIKSVTSVVLTPIRSAATAEVRLEDDKDLLITFLYRGAVAGENYSVRLLGESDNVIFSSSDFDDFDPYETGRLIVPRKLLTPGAYRLLISPSDGIYKEKDQEYNLLIR